MIAIRTKVFAVIWTGQLVSFIGAGLTGFALGVWVFQKTGSVTSFALVTLSTTLPTVLFSPLAGALVDRWDRRWALIVNEAGAGLGTLALAVLFYAGRLEIWQIYLLTGVISAFKTLQWPAYSAATTLLIPKRHLGRASGLAETAEAGARVVSPALAGFLMTTVSIGGVIVVNLLAHLFAVLTLLIVRVPRSQPAEAAGGERSSLLRDAAYGWSFIVRRSGLLVIMLVFAFGNLALGAGAVLYTPLVLRFSSATALGGVMSVGGLGMLCGTLVMSVWGGPRRRALGVVGFWALLGAALALTGLAPNILLIASTMFAVSFCLPIINSCNQALWQVKTDPSVQGRVFAVRAVIASCVSPLGCVAVGPLVDRVFEPLLAAGGPLAGTAGRVLGVGPGRGTALLFLVLGLQIVLTAASGYLNPRLRSVEDELPDAVTT